MNNYFDRVAPHYDLRLRNTILKHVRRLEKKVVGRSLDTEIGHNAIDIGCGTGFYTAELKKRYPGKIFALDSSSQMLEQISTELGASKLCTTIEEGVIDEKFDILLSCGLIEFLPDPKILFQKARGWSTETATLLILAPRLSFFFWFYFIFHLLSGQKISWFDREKIAEIGRKSGWFLFHFEHCGYFSFVAKFKLHKKENF